MRQNVCAGGDGITHLLIHEIVFFFVVQADKNTSGKITYRDKDNGGGVDADNPEVLIL